ncbi:heavy metal translocating P-type ATPase [Sabulicella glaciei]|uniref:Heavy metal translocating P-type ATPase n=1 Tax=Sabulicella glaciei TaxID=2984948 RepID=A0ABT3NZY1_9PROT|nr:heavy metal translocating P-type ATPase [Roseococcus sp. MDT2-1-1]MCW8087129.1 heavy metal translocating P-type ATPase [Roseococcus sp. MDT2-1-1]
MSMTIPVSGMTCASCATRVEKALSRLPGVASARVNLAEDRVALEGDAPLGEIARALSRAGYGLREEVWDWGVEGMSCATCVARVEKALAAVPGVLEARANLAGNRAVMRVVAGTDPAVVEAALRRAGYALTKEETGPARRMGRPEWELLAAALLAAPFLWGMVGMAFGQDLMPRPWWQLALAAPLQFGFGFRFYRGAWAALRSGTGNMDLLVALGTSAAFFLSLWFLLAEPHAHHLYFEASALVIFFVLLGKWLEGRAKAATGAAIRALLELRPRTALRLDAEGREEEIPAPLLRVGDRAAIRPGGRIPADGTVEEGEAGVDESALSGESRPVHKEPGTRLSAGTTVLDGRLVMRVTAVGEETTLSRVAAMVSAAQASRAPVQKLVDRVSAVFVPAVVVLAALTLLGWKLAGAEWGEAILPAVAVLVVACPCALGLATPAAIMAGTGAAARAGILLRDAETIERGAHIDLVAFDKTGTLTEGRPRLAALHEVEEGALALAAALQAGSEHPLARAVLAASPGTPPAVGDFRALPGRGVRGTVGGRPLLLGSARALRESGLANPFAAEAEREAAQGRTLSWLVEEGRRVIALLAFEDTEKPGAAPAIAALRSRGLRVAVLTGDSEAAARGLAQRLGLTDVAASLLPEAKLERIAEWQRQGLKVAMVGDGVNDAPSLAKADLGIAMGTGTEAAIAAAPVTLLRGDPSLVSESLTVARRTYQKIKGNLLFAFVYNAAALPLAAFGMLNPAIAGSVMAMSSVSVLANALVLARWRPAEETPR